MRKLFETKKVGALHQNDVIAWAVDRFLTKGNGLIKKVGGSRHEKAQRGLIFADGVGMGKTWEAMGTTVSLLAEMGKKNKTGENKKNTQRKRGSVLVLCPPALVANWRDEWTGEFATSARKFFKDRHAHVASLLPDDDAENKKNLDVCILKSASGAKKMKINQGGIFICKYGVLICKGCKKYAKKYGKIRASCKDCKSHSILQHRWDVIIVDEAHNKQAIEALDTLNGLKSQHKDRHSPHDTKFLLLTATPFQLSPQEWDRLAPWVAPDLQFFGTQKKPGEIRKFADTAKLAFEKTKKDEVEIDARDSDVATLRADAEKFLSQCMVRCETKREHRTRHVINSAGESSQDIRKELEGATEFTWRGILKDAIQLDDDGQTQYVRKAWAAKGLVSQKTSTLDFRLSALAKWAQRVFEEDIQACEKDKKKRPRKTLVFTEFTGKNDQRGLLKKELEKAFETAWHKVHGKRLLPKEPVVIHDGSKKAGELSSGAKAFRGEAEGTEKHRNGDAPEEYPWVMVASSVGAEGINLHTYTRRLVHFDLLWNPAKMEQREGRIDRLGRKLVEIPPEIYYLVTKDTYDERVFHRYIARQRWHNVFLPSQAKADEKEEGRKDKLVQGDAEEKISSLHNRFKLNLNPSQKKAQKKI